MAVVLVTSLFFLWGIPNNLNDILIRQFMKSFPITRLEAGLVQSAFYLGYFLLALPSAFYMRRFGYKAGFITGLVLFGSGTLVSSANCPPGTCPYSAEYVELVTRNS
jgi:FHS family L-fucose permease-like MFS transporter